MSPIDTIAKRDLEGLINALDMPQSYVRGISLLGYALLYGFTEGAAFLVEAGADPLQPIWQSPPYGWGSRNNGVYLAASLPDPNALTAVLYRHAPDIIACSTGRDKVTPMMFAAQADMANNVRTLYGAGDNPQATDRRGRQLKHFVQPSDLLYADVLLWLARWPEKASVAPRPCRQDDLFREVLRRQKRGQNEPFRVPLLFAN